jgi:hypothetical protein
MRASALVVASLLLAGAAAKADEGGKAAPPPDGDATVSMALEGFDLGSIKTFNFAPDIGTCLVELTLALGPLGIVADDEPDVIADCATVEVAARPGTDEGTLSVTTVSLFDPRTRQLVWFGSDATPENAPVRKLQHVVERLRADRAAKTRRASRQ